MAYESEMARLRAEELHIVNKDGAFTEHETKRLEQLGQIFRAEPDLRALLTALEMRQREETDAMVEKLRSPEGGIDKEDYAHMLRRHDDERERHVQDYERARELRRELGDVQQRLDQQHLGRKL